MSLTAQRSYGLNIDGDAVGGDCTLRRRPCTSAAATWWWRSARGRNLCAAHGMGEPRLVITGSGCAAANVDDPCHHDRIWRAMQSTSDIDIDTEMARQRRGAARFFWMWLIVATAMSVTGNVAHAVLHAESGIVALAAGAALVPPLVLLAATHSIAVLVRTPAGGLTYWCALLMTLALASCAFVLSFDALRSLAVTLGLPASIAWLWPCAIDVAIAQATLCLLSLSRRTGSADMKHIAAEAVSVPEVVPDERSRAAPAVSERRSQLAVSASQGGSSPDLDHAADIPAPAAVLSAVATSDVDRWLGVAESIVRDGVTSKDSRLVATILAQREAGVPPSTIGRHHRVHHSTVGRILSAAAALSA